jgi:hypothetical protein
MLIYWKPSLITWQNDNRWHCKLVVPHQSKCLNQSLTNSKLHGWFLAVYLERTIVHYNMQKITSAKCDHKKHNSMGLYRILYDYKSNRFMKISVMRWSANIRLVINTWTNVKNFATNTRKNLRYDNVDIQYHYHVRGEVMSVLSHEENIIIVNSIFLHTGCFKRNT